MVPTNIAAVRSSDRDVREAVKHILNSLGLFWEEVDEPDPLKHSVAIFPEAADFVPVTIPSIFIGETALSYYGGEKTEVRNSPPEPSRFLNVEKVRIPIFGTKYRLEGDRVLRQAPLFSKGANILVGYDLFRNVSYFLRGAESSLGMRRVRTSDRRLNPRALEEIRGVPISTPIVALHARFLLFSILLLHKREGLPLILKQIQPAGYRGAISISIPVFRRGRSGFLRGLANLIRRSETWIERLARNEESLTFFVGRGEDYTPSKVRDLLISMEEAGHEVGLLASIRASVDHMAISEEYEELASIIKRGNLGIRFRGLASTLMDAWKAAAYVQADYVLAGELAAGLGFPLGIGCPFRPDGLIWNVPLIGRVTDRRSASRVVDFASKRGCMVAVDSVGELPTMSLVRNAKEKGLWIVTPGKMIERFKSVAEVKGVFRYDRAYLEGKVVPYAGVKDLQLRVINPEGREVSLKVDLEANKTQEIRVPV